MRELSDWMAVAGATAGYMNMSDNTLDALTSPPPQMRQKRPHGLRCKPQEKKPSD